MITQEAVERISGSSQTGKELQILEVASKFFLEHGFKGTSINAMARASGISKESIYRYFDSKKDLFEAVIAKELADYQDHLQFLDDDLVQQDLDQALVNTAETILSVVNSDRTLSLRRLIFQEVSKYPDIGTYYYKVGPNKAYEHLARVFALHRDRTDFEPAQLATYFVAMVLHNTLLRRQCGMQAKLDPEQIRSVSEAATRDFLKAFFRK